MPNRTIIFACYTAFVALLLTSCSNSPYSLSDRTAKEIVSKEMQDPTRNVTILPLGRLSIATALHEQFEGAKGAQISEARFVWYQNLQKEHLITITNFRDLTKGFQGWGAWMSLSQQGNAKQFSAELTAIGKRLTCPEALAKRVSTGQGICLSPGTLDSLSVTQNQLLTRGADYFRVVRGIHDWQWDPLFLKMLGMGSMKRERKFVMLLKFDQYTKKWLYVTLDHADRNGEFYTKTVDAETVGMNVVN